MSDVSTTVTNMKQIEQAPYPPLLKGWPFIGNVLDMARDPADFFVQSYHKAGPIFRIKQFKKEYTVLAGPQANLFMSRQGNEFLRSADIWQGFAQEFEAEKLILSMDGEPHKQLRKIMKQGYSRSVLNGRYQEVIDITDEILQRDWQPGENVPVVSAMQRMVTEQLGLVITNQVPGEYVDDIRFFIKRVLNVRVTKQRPGFLMYSPAYKRAKARVLQLGREMINNHHSDPERPTILIDDLLAASAANKELISDSDLILAVVGPYIAGLDTVANTTSAALYAVLKHNHILEKVTNEVDAMFAVGTPTPQTLKNDMPLLYGSIMETLRMYPVAVAAIRKAAKDFVFAGYRVDKGQSLYMATTVSHFLPELYPNPYTFDIERYHKPRNEHRQRGAFAPYGLGAHTCLGAGMGEVLMMLTMATLFHRLRLELNPPDYELKLDPTPTPGPEMKFNVRVVGRRT